MKWYIFGIVVNLCIVAINVRIECPKCEWQPDGKAHWQCSCGHSWNTFDTKAKCPNCNKQWEKTYCPGCGQTSPHNDWYIDPTLPLKEEEPEILELKKRKRILENRQKSLGISNYRISYLKYLDYSNDAFRNPFDVGCRMLILCGVVYSVHNLDERLTIVEWFKREGLWDHVSEKEMTFLFNQQPDQKELINFSWGLEGALVLGWALNLTKDLNEIDREESDEELHTFSQSIPKIGDATDEFLSNLAYRNLEEVYDENLLNEMVTGYFRDLFIYEKEDNTSINRMVSYERHRALNWVRQFGGNLDWDETDMST